MESAFNRALRVEQETLDEFNASIENLRKDGYRPQPICPPSLLHLDLTLPGLQRHTYIRNANTYSLQHRSSSSHLLNIHTDGV